MFSRPFFPSSSSLFSSPFSRSSWFDDDPFLDEWNELLNNQYQQQQALRQRMQQQQQQLQQKPQQRIQQSKDDNAIDIERKYDENKVPPMNRTASAPTIASTPATTPAPQSSSSSGTVAPARSFWDLASFPSWSGLTSQSIRLEWSGTEPSAKEYVVSAYLPDGCTPGDVSISMDERTRMLTLKCQSKSHEEEKDKDGNIISSRSSSSFSQRSLQLPQDVNINAISASKSQYAGANSPQLLLHLPKLAAPVPQPGVKQITIN